jgi:uncharacterized membrane protein
MQEKIYSLAAELKKKFELTDFEAIDLAHEIQKSLDKKENIKAFIDLATPFFTILIEKMQEIPSNKKTKNSPSKPSKGL